MRLLLLLVSHHGPPVIIYQIKFYVGFNLDQKLQIHSNLLHLFGNVRRSVRPKVDLFLHQTVLLVSHTVLPIKFSIYVGPKSSEIVFHSKLEVAFLVDGKFFGEPFALKCFLFVVIQDLNFLHLWANFINPLVKFSIQSTLAQLVDHRGVLFGHCSQKHRVLFCKLFVKVVITHVHELLPAIDICL